MASWGRGDQNPPIQPERHIFSQIRVIRGSKGTNLVELVYVFHKLRGKSAEMQSGSGRRLKAVFDGLQVHFRAVLVRAPRFACISTITAERWQKIARHVRICYRIDTLARSFREACATCLWVTLLDTYFGHTVHSTAFAIVLNDKRLWRHLDARPPVEFY